MKLNTLIVMLVISALAYADTIKQLSNIGGKFGNTENGLVNNKNKLPPSSLRGNCYTHVHIFGNLHARWWDYGVYRKVEVKAYTKATYGNAIRSCNIPWNASVITASLKAGKDYFGFYYGIVGVVCSDSKMLYNQSIVSAKCSKDAYGFPARRIPIYHALSIHKAGSMTVRNHVKIQ